MFKAIALGATAVMVGRPILYGLAVNGEEGTQFYILQVLNFQVLATFCPSSDMNS